MKEALKNNQFDSLYKSEFGENIYPFHLKDASMQGVIAPDSILVIRERSDLSYFEYGNIYLIKTEYNSFVRYVRKHPTEQETKIILKAHDANYPDLEVPKNRIIQCGLVVGFISRINY